MHSIERQKLKGSRQEEANISVIVNDTMKTTTARCAMYLVRRSV